jgi:hypothetical protein
LNRLRLASNTKEGLPRKFIYINSFKNKKTGEDPYFWLRTVKDNGKSQTLLNSLKGHTFEKLLNHESCFVDVNGFDPNDERPIAKLMDLMNQKRKKGDHFLEIEPPEEGTIMAKIAKRMALAAKNDVLVRQASESAFYNKAIEDWESNNIKIAEAKKQIKNIQARAEAALAREEQLLHDIVLLLASIGLTPQQIADKRGIDLATVNDILD